MRDVVARLAKLPPEKRALLLRALEDRGTEWSTFPLSFAQQRLWFLDRWEPGSPAYNLPAALRLRGALDVGALEASLGEITRRHEALRTAFLDIDGKPIQVVREAEPFRIAAIDLRSVTVIERETRTLTLAAQEAARPFDLTRGPVFRATVIRLGEQDHVLLLTLHHIVADGWSIALLVEELNVLYGVYSSGMPSPLPELPLQYGDFSRWQREYLRGPALEHDLAYWRGRLQEAPEQLPLPTDHPRPPARSSLGAARAIVVRAPLASALRDLGRREGATVFMTLLAAFKTLLYRITGQSDLVVGTPVAGRTRPETERLIGFFVNTLALRTDLSGDPTFREVLRRVRESALEALAHQNLPFERLVEEVRPERDPGRTPIFQVMFTLQNAPAPALELPGLSVEPFDSAHVAAKFDWTVSVDEGDDGLHVVLVYSTDLFEGSTIDRTLSQFVRVMESVTTDPDRRVAEISLLSSGERTAIVSGWNATRREYPRDRSLSELFEEQVKLRPESVALQEEGRSFTYRELSERSRVLARRLKRMGVRAETRVGLFMDRSFEMVVGMLGIVRAGGAYVPLDPSYPSERLRWMAADSGLDLVVVGGGESGREEFGGSVRRVSVGRAPDEGEAKDREEELGEGPSKVSADTLAYVMYTSGSTGRPKGVLVPHRGVVRLVKGADYASLGPDEVFLQLAPISFDASVLEIWGSLLNGGRLVVMPAGAPSLAELGRAVERFGVTTLWLTAPLFHQMVEGHLGSLRGVRQLLSGGDVLWPRQVERVRRELPGCRMINGYGPTEGTTFACCYEVKEERFEGRSVPIGGPIANTRAYVLDSRMEPVPVGVSGELHLGGDGLARGYLGDAGLTAERFVPDAVGAESGGRLYKTGDKARYLEDGRLEFLGRLDEQVKIRGYRIEPGEIEEVLGSHPGVRGAAVVVRDEEEEGGGNRRLVAYVVPGDPDGIDGRTVREFLRERLPEYMVPSEIVVLEELPLTPSGKVDRQALPRPDGTREGGEDTRARTPVEETLAGIWMRVLGVERVGLRESFFELGGHSLLATQVISRVQEAFRVELPMRWLFERPTVGGLAERIEELLRETGEGGGVPAIRPMPRTGSLPLSFAQERMWFLDQLEPGSASYNVPMAVRLEGKVDAGALERAFGEVMRRHEALRTRFSVVAGKPIQVIEEAGGFQLETEDLRGVPEEGREEALTLRVSEEGSRPFDLAQGPLMRVLLIRLKETEQVLVVVLHHIVSDGWSLGVLVREMGELYGSYARGERPALPELPVQYADFAVWQRWWLQGTTLESQLGYWKTQLEGAPAVLDLPTDRPRVGARRHRGDHVRVAISLEEAERLHAVSRSEGATLFMTLLAAFKVLLFRHTGETDLVVGTPIAGRNRVEIEGLIGFFVNTLVLRTDLEGNPSFGEVVRRVRETALGAYAHQDFPFEKLVEEIQPERDLSHTPLFQVMFSLQNTPAEEAELAGLRLSALGVPGEGAKFELSLSMVETEEGLEGVLEYDRDLFERETIERMGGHLRRLLVGVGCDPGTRISELPILGEEEERRLLVEWQGPRTEYPRDRCVHELFEEQAERTPSAIAVEFEGERLGYGELEARANRMARHLREMGVGPEVRVGLLAERSIEMVVGLLAILKAGGAYVPLDPSYPEARLAFMLEDSKASLLLVSKLHANRWPAHRVMVLDLEHDDRLRDEGGPLETAGLCAAWPESVAYVMYTSGSSGRPKGVAVTHRGIVRLVRETDYARFGPEETFLQVATLGFDGSTFEIWGALLNGARLVLMSPQLPSLDELGWTVEQARVTTLLLTTPLFHQVVDGPIERFRGLRQLLTGGDVLSPAHARRAREALPETRIINAYGPTEGTTITTCFGIGESTSPDESVPIGRPIANTRALVLDRDLRTVPIGVVGEVFVGGSGLARGYLDHPDLTAERFVPDPFGVELGGRLYRTGDRARVRAEGGLQFIGRADRQVKIRGYRIEPGEIEEALSEHPRLREVAVTTRTGRSGEKRLVAYVVATGPEPPGSDELRTYVGSRLPEYMIPGTIVYLDALPRTPNGKLDRLSLPEPGHEAFDAARPFVAPRTPLEEKIAALWREILDLPSVSVRDDFFQLGGHSLRAVQLVFRIRRDLGTQLPVRVVFESRTIEDLCRVLEGGGGGAARPLHSAAHEVDLRAEAVLDAAIRPANDALEAAAEPRLILLTGATGFLGAFLARELLLRTNAEILCLVRAPTPEDGRRRIRDALQDYELAGDDGDARIIPLCGDLAKPRFGLSDEAYGALADSVDAVYHNAAAVNFVQPYAELRASNVMGTVEVLKLAALSRRKQVDYVSTLSVFGAPAYADAGWIREETLPERCEGLEGGYAQTKWVAERLALVAAERGIGVRVYRPGRVVGHSRTGASNAADLASRFIRACIEIAGIPSGDIEFDLTPVDYVSAAIVQLSRQPWPNGACFHLVNPEPCRLPVLARAIREAGYPLDSLPYDAWRARLVEAAEDSSRSHLLPLLPFFQEGRGDDREEPEGRDTSAAPLRFDDRHAREGLHGTGIACASADVSLLQRYISYFVRRGYLQAPPSGR